MLFSDAVLTWSVHVHVLEKSRPRCLWLVVSSMMVPFIKRWTRLDLPEKIIESFASIERHQSGVRPL